jgi:predicted metal-dependent RNase
MSAHADRHEIIRWLETLPQPPERLCFVHGEPGPMDALKALVNERLGVTGLTPEHKERMEL